MQRVCANLLLVLFSFGLIGPAVFADAGQTKLPACCRAHGKHHCAKSAAVDDHSTDVVARAVVQRCASYPQTSAMPSMAKAGVPVASQSVGSAVGSQPSVHAQTE